MRLKTDNWAKNMVGIAPATEVFELKQQAERTFNKKKEQDEENQTKKGKTVEITSGRRESVGRLRKLREWIF